MSAETHMPASRRFWSDQDAELRRLYAEHRSLAEIALLLRRPYESVKTRVKRLQLKRPARPPAVPARITAPRPRDRRKAALRRCLGGCGALFESTGPGNRICPTCAAANDTLSGGYDETSLALDGVGRRGD